jgi:predicted amidohydrolase YtcJ
VGGAIASGDASNRGTIEPGKWADLAVLSANPLVVRAEALPDIRIDLTIVAGRVVFSR